MDFTRIILRDLRRNLRRTIATVASIAVSIFVAWALMSFAKVQDQLRANANQSVRLVCGNKADSDMDCRRHTRRKFVLCLTSLPFRRGTSSGRDTGGRMTAFQRSTSTYRISRSYGPNGSSVLRPLRVSAGFGAQRWSLRNGCRGTDGTSAMRSRPSESRI